MSQQKPIVAPAFLADPGPGNAIPVNAAGQLSLTSLVPEARSLPNPTQAGLDLFIVVGTFGGVITLTATSPFNSLGNTIVTFSASGQFVQFRSIASRWRIVASDGVVLS